MRRIVLLADCEAKVIVTVCSVIVPSAFSLYKKSNNERLVLDHTYCHTLDTTISRNTSLCNFCLCVGCIYPLLIDFPIIGLMLQTSW